MEKRLILIKIDVFAIYFEMRNVFVNIFEYLIMYHHNKYVK